MKKREFEKKKAVYELLGQEWKNLVYELVKEFGAIEFKNGLEICICNDMGFLAGKFIKSVRFYDACNLLFEDELGLTYFDDNMPKQSYYEIAVAIISQAGYNLED